MADQKRLLPQAYRQLCQLHCVSGQLSGFSSCLWLDLSGFYVVCTTAYFELTHH